MQAATVVCPATLLSASFPSVMLSYCMQASAKRELYTLRIAVEQSIEKEQMLDATPDSLLREQNVESDG